MIDSQEDQNSLSDNDCLTRGSEQFIDNDWLTRGSEQFIR